MCGSLPAHAARPKGARTAARRRVCAGRACGPTHSMCSPLGLPCSGTPPPPGPPPQLYVVMVPKSSRVVCFAAHRAPLRVPCHYVSRGARSLRSRASAPKVREPGFAPFSGATRTVPPRCCLQKSRNYLRLGMAHRGAQCGAAAAGSASVSVKAALLLWSTERFLLPRDQGAPPLGTPAPGGRTAALLTAAGPRAGSGRGAGK